MLKRLRRLPVLLALLVIVTGVAVGRYALSQGALSPLRWQPVSMPLPPSIKVFAGTTGFPASVTRAWYVDVDYNDLSLHLQPWLATGATGREQGGVMARRLGAVVAINGGYFDMQAVPALTYSLVRRDGKTLVPNIAMVNRQNPPRAYPVTRSAFGVTKNRQFEVAWVAQVGQDLWAFPQPVAHTITTVAPAPTRAFPPGGHLFDAVDAIGGGPTLIRNGVIQDTYENEVFFNSGFTNNDLYPRAAIGYTRNKHLILLATDDRLMLPDRGLTLRQLAEELLRLGCVGAMNLDGGGSETLVVNGHVINQFEGRERAVTSIVAITSSKR